MKLLFVRASYDRDAKARYVVLRDEMGAEAELPTYVYCKDLVPLQTYDVVSVGGVVVQMKPCFKKDSDDDMRKLFVKGGR